MAEPARRTRDLREELEDSVIEPLFSKVPKLKPDGSVPEIVLHHRRRRARERLLDALVSRGSASVPPDLRKQTEALLRRWSAASFADAFEEVEAFEVLCALDYDRVVAEESGDREKLLAVLEQEYRRHVIEQFGRIELRGIQTSHRILQDLATVFVPLHLEEYLTERPTAVFADRRIEAPKVLKERRRILVVGAPGSGKSTLVSYLAIQSAAGNLLGEPGATYSPLPLVVTVRALKNPSLSASAIADHTGCDPRLVRVLLEWQIAVLLIDGLDEAPEEPRRKLVDSLRQFTRQYSRVYVVATSRPTGSPGEVEKQLPELRTFRLVDLSRQEVETFIDKWCLAAEISVRSDRGQAEKEADKAATDLKKRLKQSHSVQRIAVNPLLVTILCVVHRFLGRTIPEHRVTLYEKCMDALLYEWDRAKFDDGAAVGLLDAPAKKRLLMGLARRVHEEHAAELAEKEVLKHFAETLPDLGRPATDAKRIIAEIRDRSGLLVERRPGFFAFSHLTFQEYFCALDYVRTRSLTDLVELFNEVWWAEVIVLAAGTPGGGQGQIPRRLLAKKDRAAVFLAAKCLETESDMPLVLRERIDKELTRLLPPGSSADARSFTSLGLVAAPLLANALKTADRVGRCHALEALEDIDYDPAVPAIAACASDTRPSIFRYDSDGSRWKPSIGGFAGLVLAQKALLSDVARMALEEVVLGLSEEDLQGILSHYSRSSRVAPIVQSALKAERRGTPRPKRAASTG